MHDRGKRREEACEKSDGESNRLGGNKSEERKEKMAENPA